MVFSTDFRTLFPKDDTVTPGTDRRSLRNEALLSGAVYVFGFLMVATALLRDFGFPLDDSWIHQVMARNLARTGVLGFHPGQLSSGSTSLLWTGFMWLANMVAPHHVVVFNLVISVVTLFAIGWVMRRLVTLCGLTGVLGWIVALAPAASGNVQWLGLIAMEHLLFVLFPLSITLIWFSDWRGRETRQRTLLVALSCLLVTTRPEGIVFLMLLLLALPIAPRRFADWLVAVAGAALGEAFCMLENWKLAHRLTPLTMQGRGGGFSIHRDWLGITAHYTHEIFYRATKVWVVITPHVLFSHPKLVVLTELVVALILVMGLQLLWRRHAQALLFLYVWTLAVVSMYWIILPWAGHGGRYVGIFVVLFLPLFAAGVYNLVERVTTVRAAGVTVAAALLLTAAVSWTAWENAAAADIRQINTEHEVTAQWLLHALPDAARSTPPQIAVYDIGRIGYELNGNLIDLGGLVDAAFQPYVNRERTADYLEQHGIRYVLVPADDATTPSRLVKLLSLNPAHGAKLTLIHSICADSKTWQLAYAAASTAWQCQQMYSVEYVR